MASMDNTVTGLAPLTVKQVRVMMSLETVLLDVEVDSMVHSVKTYVLQTVKHQSVTRLQAIVIPGVLLVSLETSAMKNVGSTVLVVVNKQVDLV